VLKRDAVAVMGVFNYFDHLFYLRADIQGAWHSLPSGLKSGLKKDESSVLTPILSMTRDSVLEQLQEESWGNWLTTLRLKMAVKPAYVSK